MTITHSTGQLDHRATFERLNVLARTFLALGRSKATRHVLDYSEAHYQQYKTGRGLNLSDATANQEAAEDLHDLVELLGTLKKRYRPKRDADAIAALESHRQHLLILAGWHGKLAKENQSIDFRQIRASA